jgi:polysaccharide deacetylase 2 family uncharacterized protein YibQ
VIARLRAAALGAALLAACAPQQAPVPAPPAAPAAATAPAAAIPPPAVTVATAAPAWRPEDALPLFARAVTGGWRFATRYHEREWRRLTGGAPVTATVAAAGPVIALLIDDLGANPRAARRLAGLPYVVNIAVLPFTPHDRAAAALVHERGGDVLLHLPLEPLRFPADDPGPGALWVTMTTERRLAVFAADWARVPGAIGLNNHMGSRYTADVTAMAALADAVAPRDVVFVDSLTTPRSVAARQMVRRGVPTLTRTHFLDEKATIEAVSAELDAALRYARREGAALVIGHPNRATLQVLAEAAPRFEKAGVRPVTLRTLFAR